MTRNVPSIATSGTSRMDTDDTCENCTDEDNTVLAEYFVDNVALCHSCAITELGL